MKPSERILILLLGVFLTIFYTTSLTAQSRSFTVVIDPGHGGRDPGALGSTSKEKDIVLSVGLKLGKLIEDNHPDVKVIYTRDKDVFVPLNQRATIANKAHADLFISLHCNALDRRKTSPQGVETFVLGLHRSNDNLDVAKAENAVIMYEDDYSVKYEGFNPNEPESYIIFEFMANEFLDQSVQLASLVQNQLVSNSKRVNRNVRQAGFLVLREVAMPSVLVELGYISNKQEENYLKSSSGQTSLANSIYNGFREYKREHDKKSFVFSNRNLGTPDSRSGGVVQSIGGIEYRIQIFASVNKLENGAPEFKGLVPVDFYKDGNLYKYTYGKTNNPNDLKNELRDVKKKFKDAFIIELENGKRVK
ncbi:MAG: N-acetylmuramoyl-L-alanine amidase [Lascolabacillus sp.]|uniref:N-acetylmuramoyl-L-alanine amidase family protein n=1 Tax=Lascolabacillus sp. TaxID=1924068 RepID=UPI0025870309|nr:N-acetylmuramoyl-L-alanine amidase [Lascolabacillus sp.]MDD4758230.1 N-acetylmuramoyl-L-alanine amidase [Lascolabacillus sp.]